jgi:hypothetical protein
MTLEEAKELYPPGTKVGVINLGYTVPIVEVEDVYMDKEDIVVQYKLHPTIPSVVSLVDDVKLVNLVFRIIDSGDKEEI